jgi:hypothetical protein
VAPRHVYECRSQRARGLRRGSVAAPSLALWVRFLPPAWRFVCWECCVLSGRGVCVGLLSRSEGPYGLRRYLIVCDLETCTMRRPCNVVSMRNAKLAFQLTLIAGWNCQQDFLTRCGLYGNRFEDCQISIWIVLETICPDMRSGRKQLGNKWEVGGDR